MASSLESTPAIIFQHRENKDLLGCILPWEQQLYTAYSIPQKYSLACACHLSTEILTPKTHAPSPFVAAGIPAQTIHVPHPVSHRSQLLLVNKTPRRRERRLGTNKDMDDISKVPLLSFSKAVPPVLSTPLPDNRVGLYILCLLNK